MRSRGTRGARARRNARAQTGLLAAVAATELVDATAGIDDLVLARVERMRVAGDFHLDDRVFLAVFPGDLVLARHRRTRQECEIRGDILEHHVVVLRMDVGFHGTGSAKQAKKSVMLAFLSRVLQASSEF